MNNRNNKNDNQTRFQLLIIILCLIVQALIHVNNAPYYSLGALIVFCTMVLSYQIDKRFYELSLKNNKVTNHE